MPIGMKPIKGLLTLRLRQRNCAQEPVRPQLNSLLQTLPLELIEYIAAELDLVDLAFCDLLAKIYPRRRFTTSGLPILHMS